MKILGFQSESFQDWIEPGKSGLSSIIFTGNCNYRCPACHAGGLIRKSEQFSEGEILKRLERKKDYIKRVVICGGEPTLEQDLPDFLRRLKKMDFSVKLDTNGTQYRTLGELIQDKLIDYVAMDIKGPPSLYPRIVGFENESAFDIKEGIEKAIEVIQTAPGYEFRTTFVPVYRDPNKQTFSWMTAQEAREMVEWVDSFISKGSNKVRWYVQRFAARGSEDMMDPRFSKENLPKEYHQTPDNLLAEYRDVLKEKFPKADIR